jgi:hypothetical protein
MTAIPLRQVRADFDDDTLVVYQAFPAQIADAALAAGTFVPPFGMNRMTWIKPSFLWMMYRCGWVTKPGQERVLAVSITRTGFEQALRESCLTDFDPQQHGTHEEWQRRKNASPVRIQWDPERSLRLEPLPWRSLQVGLSGSAVHRYVGQWISGLTDVTERAREIGQVLRRGDETGARALLPPQRPYPLPEAVAAIVGATR